MGSTTIIAGSVATVVGSYVFLRGMGIASAYDYPVYQWWTYAFSTPADWPYETRTAISLWLKIGAAAGLGFVSLPLAFRALANPKPTVRSPIFRFWNKTKPLEIIRGLSDNHGHASWMTENRQAKLFPGPHPDYGGLVVGENYRVDQDIVADQMFDPEDRSTWGKGGTAPLLIDPCKSGPTHSIIVSGPGGYKSMSAVSTMLYWKGAAVVMDPSAELGHMLEDEKRLSGHRVVQLHPEGEEGFNALEWIDIRHPLAEANVHAIVGWAFGESSKANESSSEEFFRTEGKNLSACILAHLLWDPNVPAHHKTLATWKDGISTPQEQMRDLLHRIHHGSHSRMARQLAGILMEIVPDTFSGVYANANNGTRWLSISPYAKMLSKSTFSMSEILNGRTTVFVQIPMNTLQETPGVARMVIGTLLNQVYEARGRLKGRVLFLLDEVFQLGYMKSLIIARDVGRKYGITLQLLYQSCAQIDLQWTKEGRKAWFDAVSWRAYGSIQDPDTAEEISKACGNHSVIAISEGDNSGSSGKMFEVGSRSKGKNESRHEIRRPLIFPEEITQDARTDELFIFARGCKPMRVGRPISFRRPEMVGRVKASPMRTIEHEET